MNMKLYMYVLLFYFYLYLFSFLSIPCFHLFFILILNLTDYDVKMQILSYQSSLFIWEKMSYLCDHCYNVCFDYFALWVP